MTKTKYEFALVRPGEITPFNTGHEKTSAEDPKMTVLMCWLTRNIKGKIGTKDFAKINGKYFRNQKDHAHPMHCW